MINIYSIQGQVIYSTPVNEGSVHRKKLMNEDYILLHFNLDHPVTFDRGDYVEMPFGRYEIIDLTYPTHSTSTGGYEYDLRFDAYYWKWKNKNLFYDRQNNKEASWSLIRTPDAHLDIVCSNLKTLGYTYGKKDFTFSIDDSVDMSAKLVSYDSINIIDALTLIAETWECEWWIEDNIIHLGRCEYSTALTFELGKNVQSMSRSESNDNFATRIYAFGSTRNLPANYRENEGVVVDGVVQKRLMLPVGIPHVDAYEDMPQEQAVETVVIFDDVYPRRVGAMSDVTTKEYTDTIENEDGSTTEAKWNAYRFKDTGLTFSEEYRLSGEELRIVFTSGALNGMDFAVWFNPDKEPEKDESGSLSPKTQVFEIVRSEDYGPALPGGTLKPENGDKYVLYGFDTKFISVDMLPAAEQELKERAEEHVKKSKEDPSVYDCLMNPVDMTENNIDLNIGHRIRLIHSAYFEDARDSRIYGFEKYLDGSQITYTVGETAKYSRLADVEGQIKEITYGGNVYTGSGSSGVYVIDRYDTTRPSDRNVFSALRSLQEFVSKKYDDIIQGAITFLKHVKAKMGIRIGEYVPGYLGSGANIDEHGFAEMTGLKLREFLEVPELRFNRIDVISGEQWNAVAFGLIESVDPVSRIIKLKLQDGELHDCRLHDFCRGIFHNLTGNTGTGGTDACGFNTLPGFSTSYFTPTELYADGFRYSLKPGTAVHPSAGMRFAVYGNATDKNRQASAYSTRTYKKYLRGVNTWEVKPEHVAMQFGDCTGLVVNGKDMSGYSAYLNNIYITGVIEWLEEHKEEFKGKDGYSVSLSCDDAVIAVNSDGQIDASLYEIINIVAGEERACTGDYPVTATRYKVQTRIQAMCGSLVLEPGETVSAGKYLVSVTASGCGYSYSGGVVTVTRVTEDKATLDIEINCEGVAVFNKVFTLTRVYGERGFSGNDGKDIEFIFLRSATPEAETPVSENRDGYVPGGWTDNPSGVTSLYIYELISRRVKVNGAWGEYSPPVPWSRYASDGASPYYLNLTNDSATLPADKNGHVTNYSPAVTTAQLFMGQEPCECVFEAEGITGGVTFVQDGPEFSVTAVPDDTDSARLTISAKVDGISVGSVVFSISKAKAGEDGKPVTIHYLQLSADIVKRFNDGTTDLTSIGVSARQKTGDALPEVSAGTVIRYKRSDDGEWIAGNTIAITDNTVFADVELVDSATNVLLDSERIPVVFDGIDGDDGKDGAGVEIIFRRSRTSTPRPDAPATKQQDGYVPEGWTDNQSGTSEAWPYEFACRRRKVNGVWGGFSEPALWSKYGFDGNDAYSAALSSYESVITLNNRGEIDSSLYDIVNVVSGQEKVYAGGNQVVAKQYKVQTKIYAWHGVAALSYADTAGSGTYSASVTATGCECTIAGGVITVTRIAQDKAAVDMVINCEGKITFEKTFTVTRVWNGQDANLLPWLEEWNGYANKFGSEYIATPRMFSGIKDPDGKLTGIAQGEGCIAIDGERRTGIFALVGDEVVFELDPVNRKYRFTGEVHATSGSFSSQGDSNAVILDKGILKLTSVFGDDAVLTLSRLMRKEIIDVIAGNPIYVYAFYARVNMALPGHAADLNRGDLYVDENGFVKMVR